jgi:hypothetical protein
MNRVNKPLGLLPKEALNSRCKHVFSARHKKRSHIPNYLRRYYEAYTYIMQARLCFSTNPTDGYVGVFTVTPHF